jgi:hypothetical protein
MSLSTPLTSDIDIVHKSDWNEVGRDGHISTFSQYVDERISASAPLSTLLDIYSPSPSLKVKDPESHESDSYEDRLVPGMAYLRRIGWTGTIVLTLGTIIILVCLSFLSFLWFSTWSASHLWHNLIIRGWLPISITISTLIMKTAIGFQEGLGTMMLAALALKHFITSTHNIAAVSIIRSSSTAPLNLAV